MGRPMREGRQDRRKPVKQEYVVVEKDDNTYYISREAFKACHTRLESIYRDASRLKEYTGKEDLDVLVYFGTSTRPHILVWRNEGGIRVETHEDFERITGKKFPIPIALEGQNVFTGIKKPDL